MHALNFHYIVLNRTDVREVLEYIWDFRAVWKCIGRELSIDLGTLEAIERDNSKCEDCLREMIIQWIRNAKAPPTWVTLDKALQSKNIRGKILPA